MQHIPNTVVTVKEAGAPATAQTELLVEVDSLLAESRKALKHLEECTAHANKIENAKERAFYYKDVVDAAMTALRKPVDKLEMLVDSDIWPMPTYGRLMFEI